MPRSQYLCDLSLDELIELSAAHGYPPFQGKILHKWIFKKGAQCLEDMTDLPKSFRAELAQGFHLHRIERIDAQSSADGTEKLLYRLHDGHCIETVKIPEGDRLTLCISTQVGCSVGCRFCASGRKGLERNLEPGEIVDQVLLTIDQGAEALTNIVFMGIGEPLLNFNALAEAIRIINGPQGLEFGARRITVSTVGLPEGMRKLADLGLQINMAVSLHAADEKKRADLIPMARKIRLREILDAADYFREKTTRDVMFEILLLREVNDGLDDARKLAALLKGRKCLVNLIPFNAIKGLPFDAPGRERVDAFRSVLEGARMAVTVRRARGRDIRAACGQLRLKRMEN
jgi:23S rRNA (adenine2503-C2)-methyltransferase